MAFTPAATAFGDFGDLEGNFAGVLTPTGLEVVPFQWYDVAFNHGRVAEGDTYPMFLLQCYPLGDAGDRTQAAFDGIWLTNQSALDEEGIVYKSKLVRDKVSADLADGDNSFILALNHWQTITADMVVGKANMSLASVNTPGRRVKGVAVMRGSMMMAYHSKMFAWDDIVAIMPAPLTERISPMPAIPFACAFDGQPKKSRDTPTLFCIYYLFGTRSPESINEFEAGLRGCGFTA